MALGPLPPPAPKARWTFDGSLLKLRNRLGREFFEEFIRDFSEYTREATEAVTDAPTDQILVAQGRAQQCRSLLKALREALNKPLPQ